MGMELIGLFHRCARGYRFVQHSFLGLVYVKYTMGTLWIIGHQVNLD